MRGNPRGMSYLTLCRKRGDVTLGKCYGKLVVTCAQEKPHRPEIRFKSPWRRESESRVPQDTACAVCGSERRRTRTERRERRHTFLGGGGPVYQGICCQRRRGRGDKFVSKNGSQLPRQAKSHLYGNFVECFPSSFRRRGANCGWGKWS